MKTILKQIALISALTLTAPMAFAQEASAQQQQQAESASDSLAIGNTAPINSGNTSRGSDLSNAVGMAVAPALTTTLTETCMGSTSVGAGFSGGSFSFGTTWRDSACVRRLDAREIKSFGDAQAAKEIMCDSDQVRDAFRRVGRPCAVDGGTYTAVSQVEAPAPVVAPVSEAVDQEVTDEQDLSQQQFDDIIKRGELARAAMAARGY
jgi:hypothetical protein